MSITLTLNGNTNVLSDNFFPPIDLTDGVYTIGMLSFDSFHTIPNIIKNESDMFYIGDISIQIPEGSYNIETIAEYLNTHADMKKSTIVLRGNNSTWKSEIRSTQPIYFNVPGKPNCIGPLLGFMKPNTVLSPIHGYHVSDGIVQIMKVNVISIHCNIAGGSYINGEPDHVIYQFFPAVEPGYKIIETPSPVIYHPINVRTVDNITLRIIDQNSELVDFRGENITIRLHIKKNGD